ncbi:MAG: isopenicillin N synthase family oxygenase [Gammaproteobacteria bacterium]|nr:isopenicillin N synthase family oxygenase [Gammaproteobacteria bacterium]
MYVNKVDFTDPNAAKLFSDSLRDTGFAVITHHPLDMNLIKAVYKEWEGFFNSDYKNNYIFDRKTHDGFFPADISEKAKGYNELDLKEYYHYHAWAKLPKELSNKTKELHTVMANLASLLLGWLEKMMPNDIAVQLSGPLGDMITNCPKNLLRILHYPPLQGSEVQGAIRAAAHEDINLITLLPAATAAGLQVKDKLGNWHDVPGDPGSIVINSGDMLEECTQGYYKATTHQVCNPLDASANTSRYSMPFFLHPRDEVVLSPRHTAFSYWKERMEELGVM